MRCLLKTALSVLPFVILHPYSDVLDGLYFVTLAFPAYLFIYSYCKTLYICGFKILQIYKNDILANVNSGIYDLPWSQIIEKI